MSEEKPDFGGLKVASFESRRANEMEKMISKFNGQPLVSPSMREVPLEKNRVAIDFAPSGFNWRDQCCHSYDWRRFSVSSRSCLQRN